MTYLILLLVVILVNSLPAFAPPTWTVLISFYTGFELNIYLVILIGVLGATFGRFILAHYIQWFSHQLFNEKQHENLNYLGNKIGGTPVHSFIFTFIYSLTPLSTTVLFVAAGIAKVRLSIVLAGFALGRLISYTALLYSTAALATNIKDLTSGTFSLKNILSSILGLAFLLLFIFIDWKELIEKKKLKLEFDVWKWSKE